MADRKLDWDSEVENDGGKGFELLPEGEYRFGVMELKKSTSKNPDLDHCPIAVLTLAIFDLSDTEYKTELARIEDNLVLHTKCEWKLCEFFRAIGDRKHGQKLKPNWNEVPSSSGRCKIKIDVFEKRDKTKGKSNKVDRYLDPDVPVAPPPPAQEEQPAKPEDKKGLAF